VPVESKNFVPLIVRGEIAATHPANNANKPKIEDITSVSNE